MTWNYRVIKTIDSTGGLSYGVHEVYYDENRMPRAYTEQPVPLYADTLPELISDLERMRAALSAPVLTEADFPNNRGEIVDEQTKT